MLDKSLNKPAAGRAEQPLARGVAAAALVAGAVIHLVDLPPSSILPVLNALFIASAVGMLLGVVLLARPAPRLGWLIGGGTAFLTFLGYVVSRTTGLPGIVSAIGEWFYPLGIPSLIVEGIAFCLAAWALLTGPPRRG
ncbi:MAG: hypothetical protein JO272_12230 [Pseudonocardiales bacterium]|nr:hypothetical protein [Pseudonocardiales bacterium]